LSVPVDFKLRIERVAISLDFHSSLHRNSASSPTGVQSLRLRFNEWTSLL
jgi:hypothetical protein